MDKVRRAELLGLMGLFEGGEVADILAEIENLPDETLELLDIDPGELEGMSKSELYVYLQDRKRIAETELGKNLALLLGRLIKLNILIKWNISFVNLL